MRDDDIRDEIDPEESVVNEVEGDLDLKSDSDEIEYDVDEEESY